MISFASLGSEEAMHVSFALRTAFAFLIITPGMSSFPSSMAWAEEEDDEVEVVIVTEKPTSSGSSICPAGFCEPNSEPGDCGGMPCGGGGGDGGEGGDDAGNDEQTDSDVADEGTASEVNTCVRGNVSAFGAISPHALRFDDNLSGTADLDGDGAVDTDSNGNAIQYPAEGQARRTATTHVTRLGSTFH